MSPVLASIRSLPRCLDDHRKAPVRPALAAALSAPTSRAAQQVTYTVPLPSGTRSARSRPRRHALHDGTPRPPLFPLFP